MMRVSKTKIWIKYFFKSFVWLILPICIFGSIRSCENYIEAKQKLTPYSVNVSGYTRKDGTNVSSHKRRPPGGVKHDAPYKRDMRLMGFLFFASVVGGCGSVLLYRMRTIFEIENQESLIMAEEIKKRQEFENEQKIQRLNELKKREEEKQLKINTIIKSLDYIFTGLRFIPPNIKRGNLSKCKFCKKHISRDDFCISFLAITRIHFVCMDCLIKYESIGKDQPKSKFENEIKYYNTYLHKFNNFKNEFLSKLENTDITIENKELKRLFDLEIMRRTLKDA